MRSGSQRAAHSTFLRHWTRSTGSSWRANPTRPCWRRRHAAPARACMRPETLCGWCDAASAPRFSVCEVARHTTPEDCWLIIKGKVYDVSGWAAGHPGGAVIYTHGGKASHSLLQSELYCFLTSHPSPRTPPTPSPPSTLPRRGIRCARARLVSATRSLLACSRTSVPCAAPCKAMDCSRAARCTM